MLKSSTFNIEIRKPERLSKKLLNQSGKNSPKSHDCGLFSDAFNPHDPLHHIVIEIDL